MDIEQFNREQRLRGYPEERRIPRITGVEIQERPGTGQPALIAIGYFDQTGVPARIWTDLPNAMFLLKLLADVQNQTGAKMPLMPPGECGPFDGSV
jgi:hypothetical protein